MNVFRLYWSAPYESEQHYGIFLSFEAACKNVMREPSEFKEIEEGSWELALPGGDTYFIDREDVKP